MAASRTSAARPPAGGKAALSRSRHLPGKLAQRQGAAALTLVAREVHRGLARAIAQQRLVPLDDADRVELDLARLDLVAKPIGALVDLVGVVRPAVLGVHAVGQEDDDLLQPRVRRPRDAAERRARRQDSEAQASPMPVLVLP